jgi:hypothetical protein
MHKKWLVVVRRRGGFRKPGIYTTSPTLKTTIKAKQKSIGRIARLKELLRALFQCSDAERTSFKERRAISPTTTAAPYWGSPGLVTMEIALEEIALEEIALDEIALDEIMLNRIQIPPINNNLDILKILWN